MAGDIAIGNEVPSANAARLPGLGAPEMSVDYLGKMKEIIEVLVGRRGSTWDRAVTFRDLQDGGLGGFIPGAGIGVPALFNPTSGQITTPGGSFDIDAALRESAAYKDLLAKIGSAEELESLPEQISRQLRDALIDVARERGTAINRVEAVAKNAQQQLAWRLDEITASLNTAAAGVREYSATFADEVRAVATRVEQVAAELEAGGGGVEVQEQITAIADAVEGLQGQWSLKIQTNPTAGQPPVIAGIALSVQDPIAGPGTSSLVFMSEKVGFYTENGTLNPFSISGNQVMATDLIAKRLRVIMDDGTVVLDANRSLASQTMTNPNLVPRLSSWPAGGRAGGAYQSSNLSDSRFLNGEYIGLPNSGSYVGVTSAALNIPNGAWVTVGFDAYCDGVGRVLNVDLYGGGVDTNGLSVTLDGTQKRFTFSEQVFHQNAAAAALRIFCGTTGPQAVISNIKVEYGRTATAANDTVITKENVSTFIKDAAIGLALIDRATIGNLQALVAYLGNVEIGAGGALRQGQTGYDQGIGVFLGAKPNGSAAFSIATANGGKFLCDPENNVLKLVNPQVEAPQYSAFSVSIGGDIDGGGSGKAIVIGQRTANITGFSNFKSIRWSISDQGGDGSITAVNETSLTCNFRSNVAQAPANTFARVTCTVVGLDGRTVTDSVMAYGEHV